MPGWGSKGHSHCRNNWELSQKWLPRLLRKWHHLHFLDDAISKWKYIHSAMEVKWLLLAWGHKMIIGKWEWYHCCDENETTDMDTVLAKGHPNSTNHHDSLHVTSFRKWKWVCWRTPVYFTTWTTVTLGWGQHQTSHSHFWKWLPTQSQCFLQNGNGTDTSISILQKDIPTMKLTSCRMKLFLLSEGRFRVDNDMSPAGRGSRNEG